MDYIKEAVIDCRGQAPDDDQLIESLTHLAQQQGSLLYQAVFDVYAGLDLPPQVAEEYWHEILSHRRTMTDQLGRSLDLLPAIYDYLASSPHAMSRPRLIDEKNYARILMETTHDGLTAMHNRPYFDQALEQSVSAARRYGNDISLLFIDIDDFKEINDTHGHRVGDTVLRQVAGIILAAKRESDIAARYGGEEFVLLMPHTPSINSYVLAERIRTKIEENRFGDDELSLTVTVSGGLSSFPHNSKDSAELVHHADNALYLAKGAGKNIVCLYKEEKRRYLRVKYREPVKAKELGFDDSPIFAGTSKDICLGGILFENVAPLPIGARIQVSLPIQKGKPLLLIGTVVRVERFGPEQYEIGMSISFKEMEKIASSEIASFLQNTLS